MSRAGPGGQFRSADLVGNEDGIHRQCNPCGNHTVVSDDRTSCGWEQGDDGRDQVCKFTSQDGRKYDFSKLGAEGGGMVDGGRDGVFSYYLNPCYTSHTNIHCVDEDRNPLPYMACQVEKIKSKDDDDDDDDDDGDGGGGGGGDGGAGAKKNASEWVPGKVINLGSTIGYTVEDDAEEPGHLNLTFVDYASSCRRRQYGYGSGARYVP